VKTATPNAAPADSGRNSVAEVPAIPDHELLRCIGRGSYGEVWLARNVLGSYRAVKVIYRRNFEHDRPYEREFEGIQKFEPISRSHESQVDILHVGRNDEAGYFYYVMELADDADSSAPVAAEVTRLTSKSGDCALPTETDRNLLTSAATYQPHTLKLDLHRRAHLPVDECVRIGLALTTALENLHGHELVHRDIKPSNIIFVNGVPKLADIGLVASMDATMSFVGTSGFLPPEGPGTPQSDIYSLGKVLYEMCMGRDRQDFPKLPAALADSADGQRLLELNTVILKACHHDPQQRYESARAMAAELELLRGGESVRSRRAVERRCALARKSFVAAAVIALVATGMVLLLNRFSDSTIQLINGVPEINSVAVLPFVNQDNERPHKYLAQIIGDETMNALTNCAGLRVVPRSTVLAFRPITNDLRQIGKHLGVQTVLAGSMKKTSNQLYFTARIINVTDSTELWSKVYDGYRRSTNILDITKDIASNVAHVLKVPLPESASRQMETSFIPKLAAYRLYSQAITNWRNNSDGINATIELLNRAILEDPNFAEPYADLADCYLQGADWLLPPKQAMTEAKKNAQHAVELDDSLWVAHLALGRLFLANELDFNKAKAAYERAIEAFPTDGRVYGDYALALSGLGRFNEAEQILKRGDAADPENHNLLGAWGDRYYHERDFEDSIRASLRMLALYSNSAAGLLILARAQERLGRYEDALATAQRMMQVDTSPDFVAFLGMIQARLGHREEADKALRDVRATLQARRTSPIFAAIIPLALGQTNQAIEDLQRAVDEYPQRALALKRDPFWDELRGDSRFQALLKKVSIPE
jgi:serine/threonine protein kinase/Flp pilus assembly protein TadD